MSVLEAFRELKLRSEHMTLNPEPQTWPPAQLRFSMPTVAIWSVRPGIITTGSTLREYQYYVSAYRIRFSGNGEHWETYREASSTQEKVRHAPRSVASALLHRCLIHNYCC